MEKYMKNLFSSIALIVPVIALGAASNPDSSFYKNAAEGGIAEVQLGKLAQEKSSNPSVKEFGAMMVSDHTAADDKLQAMPLPRTLSFPQAPAWDSWRQRRSSKFCRGTVLTNRISKT
jgi:predicted outer membrane protein